MKLSVLAWCLGLAVLARMSPASGYNDDHGILKWNPLWLSYPKYSAPIADYGSSTSRGYMFKRLMDEHERPYYNWSPYYNYKPSSSNSVPSRHTPYFLQKRSPASNPYSAFPRFTGWKVESPVSNSGVGLIPERDSQMLDSSAWESSEPEMM